MEDFLCKSAMKVKQEVCGNWNEYWANATFIDMEEDVNEKNHLFVLTKSIPSKSNE